MKKLLLSVAVSAALLGTVSVAQAASYMQASTSKSSMMDRVGQFYFSPSIGWFGDNNRSLDSSVTGGATFGYNFTKNWAAQINGMVLTPKQKSTGNRVNGTLFNLEGVYNHPLANNFVPYVAAGVGLIDLNDSKGAWDVGAGLKYFIAPKINLSLNYRFIRTFNDSLNNNMATFGVGFLFSKIGSTATGHGFSGLKSIPQCGQMSAGQARSCYTINGNTVTMFFDAKFKNNTATLSSHAQSLVNNLATFMQAYPTTQVEVVGHASKIGPQNYNTTISKRRADNVKQYLVNKAGIDASRISTQGVGYSEPVASDATAAGRALNRRADAQTSVTIRK